MSSLITIAALAATLPVAQAADRAPRSAHFVFSSYHVDDEAFDLYSPNDALGSMGLRLEQHLRGPLSLVGSYSRRRVASEYFDSLVNSGKDPSDTEEAALVASFAGQQITLGPKLRHDFGPAFSVYAVGQGLAFVGTTRIDDDPTADDNPSELTMRAWAPGFVAAGGVEFAPKIGSVPLSTFLEMGYNWTAQMDFNDPNIRENGTNEPASMGDLAFRGFYVQLGVGVRF
jgi:hypothetical protein